MFDVIETVDRPKLAHALAKEMERTGRRLACFVEVNTGESPRNPGYCLRKPTPSSAFVDATMGEMSKG